ncbi:MAG: Hpt domain-containing protein [Chloroflexi bacterium]|nr:Hpt domain-containing protein [Chloroflexota bacterium]MCI0863097.1 Hpt domain-containing protein [Chloroflexota bacterium]
MENSNDDTRGEIIVRLDPLIQDIVIDFLQHRRENASAISDAIETSDFETVGDIGHDIEGTAGAFGFSEMGLIGRSLQQAAHESSLVDIRTLAEELTSYLDRLRIVYE